MNPAVIATYIITITYVSLKPPSKIPGKKQGAGGEKSILRVATADFGDLRGAIQKNSPAAGREARAAREALVVGLVPMAWNSEQVELSRPKNLVRIRDGPSRPCS